MLVSNAAVRVVDDCTLVHPEVARAATRYQVYREVEAAHLAIMSQHNLSVNWTPEVRQMVFTAGDHIRHARDARSRFRQQIREFVVGLRRSSTPLADVVRQTRSMVRVLERTGAVRQDDGALEAELVEWAIEEYEGAA